MIETELIVLYILIIFLSFMFFTFFLSYNKFQKIEDKDMLNWLKLSKRELKIQNCKINQIKKKRFISDTFEKDSGFHLSSKQCKHKVWYP